MISLVFACLWLVSANVIGMLPSRDHHWTAAYILIALGLPILIWVIVQNGFLIGLLVLAAASSILRWPVVYLWRWVKRKTGVTKQEDTET